MSVQFSSFVPYIKVAATVVTAVLGFCGLFGPTHVEGTRKLNAWGKGIAGVMTLAALTALVMVLAEVQLDRKRDDEQQKQDSTNLAKQFAILSTLDTLSDSLSRL